MYKDICAITKTKALKWKTSARMPSWEVSHSQTLAAAITAVPLLSLYCEQM